MYPQYIACVRGRSSALAVPFAHCVAPCKSEALIALSSTSKSRPLISTRALLLHWNRLTVDIPAPPAPARLTAPLFLNTSLDHLTQVVQPVSFLIGMLSWRCWLRHRLSSGSVYSGLFLGPILFLVFQKKRKEKGKEKIGDSEWEYCRALVLLSVMMLQSPPVSLPLCTILLYFDVSCWFLFLSSTCELSLFSRHSLTCLYTYIHIYIMQF